VIDSFSLRMNFWRGDWIPVPFIEYIVSIDSALGL